MFTQNRANNFSAKAEFVFDKDINITPLEYNIQDISLPSINLNPIQLDYKGLNGNIPGDTLDATQELELQFILDEELEVLFTLMQIQDMNWKNGRSKDLLILNILNHKNKVIATASFKNVWLQVISGITYTTKGEDTTVILPVTISYLDYALEKVK